MLIKILKLGAVALILTSWAGQASAQTNSREVCREYTKTIYIGGKAVEGYGTACRQQDGSWEISKLKGSEHAQTKVKEHIVEDLRDKGAREIIVIREPYYASTPALKARKYVGYPYGYYNSYHRYYNNKHYKKSHYNHHGAHYKKHHRSSGFGFGYYGGW